MSETNHDSKTEEVTPLAPAKSSFYDSKYWQDGEGQLLWNMRKVLAFIMKISPEGTPAPFLTVTHKSDFDDSWIGWYASWNEGENTSLYLEYEGTAFCVYVMDVAKDTEGKLGRVDMRWWYNFGDTDPKEKVNDWNELGDAMRDARAWLVENHTKLTEKDKDGLKGEFNIK